MLGDNRFDFSGMDRFWAVAAILESGREPDREQWEALFNTPGYAVLIQSEFTKEFFIEKFKWAFMPQNAAALDAAIKAGGDPFLSHYVRVKGMKDQIGIQREKLEAAALTLAEEALGATLSWLPRDQVGNYPPVSFLIFANDARGYPHVVVDVVFAIEQGSRLPLMLGHEFFHFYASKLLVFDPEKTGPAEKSLFWVLRQIHEEGIADQIHALADGQYEEMVKKTPEIIRAMDALLCEMADFPEKREDLGRQLQKLVPRAGHPTGFYMASVVLKQLGKQALIREVGNPFAFFHQYNRAAEMAEGVPTFSKEAMNQIARLEAKCSHKGAR